MITKTLILFLFSSVKREPLRFFKHIMETINKWIEHVVRDFLRERENRAMVICNTILLDGGGHGGICEIETIQ